MTTTYQLHAIPIGALRNDYNEQGQYSSVRTPFTIVIDGRRFGMGYTDATGECRRVTDGPKLPGPYAYAWAKASVIDNQGGTGAEMDAARADGMVVEAKYGDFLVTHDGEVFRVEKILHDPHNIKLVHIP